MSSNEDRRRRLTMGRLLHPKAQSLSPEERRRRQAQADIARQLRHWPPRRVAAWTLFVLAIVIAAQHVVAHGGVRPLPLSMGWQDLLVGYPMAALIFLVGLFVLEPRGKN